ncbi:MAG: response regulator [Candidatus Omnitrophota bacterium]
MKRILLVDDEKKIRKIYNKLLTQEGYNVIEAVNAMQASEILVREKVDLVLLDINMPEIDGGILYDIMELFHKDVKVVVSSVYLLDEQRERIKGAYDYHDKSQGNEILLDKIRTAIENSTT